MNGRKMTSRQGRQSSTQALTLKGQLQNNKMKNGDTVTTFFMKISDDKNQLGAIGEIISSPSGMHLQEEGTFAEVMDLEGSQCIQRNNTLKVKTPGLIVLIIMSLNYISKYCYITSRCCSCGNNP
jgi:hypothetical protein